MNQISQMQGGKNWILPKDINANRFFGDSHWLEIWKNHFCFPMGPSGGSLTMDSGQCNVGRKWHLCCLLDKVWVKPVYSHLRKFSLLHGSGLRRGRDQHSLHNKIFTPENLPNLFNLWPLSPHCVRHHLGVGGGGGVRK